MLQLLIYIATEKAMCRHGTIHMLASESRSQCVALAGLNSHDYCLPFLTAV